MKRILPLLAVFGLTLPLGADVLLTYGTAGSVTSLAASSSAAEITPADLVAGAGLDVQTFGTFNFQGWDPESVSFADAVAADDIWTWGFTVDSAGVDLTTMDIRVDRSGMGPDDIEIQAVVKPNGGVAGAPISLLTYDYADGGSGVNFLDVDLTAIPSLGVGDSVVFTLGAFNSESADGTLDLETVSGADAIIINGDIVGALPKLSVIVDRTAAFENEAGGLVFLAVVSRTGDMTDPVTVTVTNPDTTELDVPVSVDIPAGEPDGLLFFDVKDDADMDGSQDVTLDFSATGFEGTSVEITVLDDDSTTDDVVLNEALINTTGADTEFLELYNNTGATVDIQGWSIVFYDSDSGESGPAVASVAIPSGSAVDLAAGGFYLIGDDAFVAAFPTATPDLSQAAIGTPGGSQTAAVFDAAGNLVYTVLFDDSDGEANVGGAPITPDATIGPDGVFLPAGFRFVADGGGFAEMLEFSPVPAPSATPGFSNVLTPELGLSFSAEFIEEGASAEGTITRRYADTSSELVVVLSDDDTDDSELEIPPTVTIPVGATSASFEVTARTDGFADGFQTVTVMAYFGSFTWAATIGITDVDAVQFTDVVINEIDSDQTSTDTAEFVELYNLTASDAPLDGLVLVFFNGSNDSVYRTIDLTEQTIPASGFFVVGHAATVANVDLDFVGDLGFADNNVIQNGADAVALFVGTSADFPNGTTAEFAATNFTLLDVIVYDTNDGDDAGLLAAFTPAEQINENENGTKDTDSVSRSVDGTGAFGVQAPTPGAGNTQPEAADLLIVGSSFNFGTNEVILTISGMDAVNGVYGLESSTDLNQVDAWTPVGGVFFVGLPNVVETAPGSGIYNVTVTDAELGSEVRNFYRVSEQ